MEERKAGMVLDRKVAIGNRDEDRSTDADKFVDKPPLPVTAAEMLEHGVGCSE
jgi:hypothetical protein